MKRVYFFSFLFLLTFVQLAIAQESVPTDQWALEKAISYALDHNLELQIAKKKVEIAKAEWIKGKTFPFNPELEAESFSDSQYANEGEKGEKFGLSQELEIFGQRWVRNSAARFRLEAAQADYRKIEKSLIAKVREVFTNQLFLEKLRETLKLVLEFDKEIWDAAQKRFEEGVIRQIDFDLTRIEYNRTKTESLKAESDWTSGRLSLNRLLGFPDPLIEIKLKGELRFPPLKLSVEQLIQLALEHRGDFQSAQLEFKASQKELSLARREVFPNPKIGIFYEREKSTIEDLHDDDKLLGFSVGLPLPLLNRNQGERARTFAAMGIADLTQKNVGLDVKAQVAESYQKFKNAQEILELYADMEDRLTKDLELVRIAYTRGQISIENYLTQKDHFLQAKLDFLDSFKNYAESRKALEQAVGMKWEDILFIAEGEKK